MHALPTDQYSSVIPLLDTAMPNAPVLRSILEGRRPGRVYVESVATPTVAVAVSDYGFGFVTSSWEDARAEAVIARLARSQALYLVCAPDAPIGAIDGARMVERMEFSGEPTGLVVDSSVPIVPIDAAHVERCQWRGEVIKACGSAEAFLTGGLGRCALIGAEVAAEAYGLFWGAGAVEIGAITHPAYRRQGLARRVASAVIAACARAEHGTVWSCHVTNAASMAVAESLGYPVRRPYRLWQLDRRVV